MKSALEISINQLLNKKLASLEAYLKADVLAYYGSILDNIENHFLRIVEGITYKKENIYIVLNTTGGSATAVERFVKILRHNYKEVNFIVPNYAYSAGTIFCMSGDKIFMDYFSVLGPIDPQVSNKEGKLVAALGYLDKVNEFIEKSKKGILTQAEFIMLKDLDLAELRGYEQAKNLTIDLLKNWLVKYKFKDWTHHKSTKKPVSMEEKIERATEIADKLSDSNKWKSHGRPIDIETLTNELRLKIDDYSKDEKLRPLIREYDELMSNYANSPVFIHTRNFI
ncbi:SDH family Clp fold serine proteinase [Capnocytophaga sp.]